MKDSEGTAAPPTPGRLLSIGIPVFNGRSLLRNCLQSVIISTLTRDRFEIVVADDGSTEPETLAILEEFETSLAAEPGFFRVIRMDGNSGGAARPRNRILDEAVGEYVFFIDSDDTIGTLALERIADEVSATQPDWVALNQIPMNGRGAVCTVRKPRMEVPRLKALSTLTVHKCFRRAEIERQGLRFDERLPSGQDVSFAFSYIVNARSFVMLGAYDYYYLTHHAGNPNEPAHLSRLARTPQARIEQNQRILASMLTALRGCPLPEAEKRTILIKVSLPRVLLRQGYLTSIVTAGPISGPPALRRLARTLDDPLLEDLDAASLVDVTPEQLAVITAGDWLDLVRLFAVKDRIRSDSPIRSRLIAGVRRLLDRLSGRTRHRQVLAELAELHRMLEDALKEQRRLAAALHAAQKSRRTPP